MTSPVNVLSEGKQAVEGKKVKMVLKVPTKVYSRVSGYYRPVENWNPGKRQEFSERTYMKVEEIPGAIEKVG